jgi:hypothetical protein
MWNIDFKTGHEIRKRLLKKMKGTSGRHGTKMVDMSK